MRRFIFLILLLSALQISAQESVSYQTPPNEILELVDVPRAPSVLIDEGREYMIFLYRDAYKSIEQLSQEELRLGGLRIDPKTNIGSRVTYYNNVKIKNLKDKKGDVAQVNGLPNNPKLTNFKWSPDESKIALTNTTANGVEVWVLDLATAAVTKITSDNVNANVGNVINWFEDGQSLLVKIVSEDRGALIDTKTAVPSGPTVSVNDGKKAQNRTYQDLLKNENDAYNFEQLALSELHKVTLEGKAEKWLANDIYTSVNFSPDGNYVLVKTVEKPFSYLVPYNRFPSKTSIYTKAGEKIETVVEVPLIEDLPQGFMAVRKDKRDFQWRSDKPATVVYTIALDGGDPENEVAFRDEIFEMEYPFKGNDKTILKTINRMWFIDWGHNSMA
ncbi:MAG: dipeptidyl aminopeptidase/acylaminoacyl peptidase, partial [Cryomorphaceae bacterium]